MPVAEPADCQRRQDAADQGKAALDPPHPVGFGNEVGGGDVDEGACRQGHHHAKKIVGHMAQQGVGNHRSHRNGQGHAQGVEDGEFLAVAVMEQDGEHRNPGRQLVADDRQGREQTDLGVDFEKDIMPWAGEEFFVAFSSYKALPLPVMPAPKIYFGIKSKDKAACEKCMQQMLPALNLKDLKKDTISEVNYYFSPVPTPNNIMPEFGLTLAYVNDFLIFASSKDALNPLIAARSKPEKSLSMNAEFTKGLGALLKSSIFTSYYNNALGSDFINSVLQMTPEYKLGELETDVLKLINVASGGFTFKEAALKFRFTLSVNKEIYNKILSPEWIKKAGSQK